MSSSTSAAVPLLERRPAGRTGPPSRGRPRLVAVGGGRAGTRDPAARRRVLVVDDEPSMRALCRVNLQIDGLDVLEAVDGDEALALAARERPDLVLLDVMMPGVDGWEVARRLAQEPGTRDVPVVFMTALASDADRLRGFEAGAVGYLVKPFDPLLLGERVRSTLERLAEGERERLRREVLEEG